MPHQRGTNRVRRLVKYGRVIVLGAVVSFAAIYLIFTQLRDNDLSLIGAALRNARYSYVALSALIIAAGLFARGARWRALLNNDLSFWRAFSINNVAYLINGLIPFRVGELAKIYLATRAEPPVPVLRSTSTIIVERLLDLISIFVITLLAVSQGDLPEDLRRTALFLAPLAVVGFVILVVLSGQRERTLRVVGALVARLPIRWNVVGWMEHFLDGLSPLTDWRRFALVGFFNVLSWVSSVVSGYVLMFAFFDQAHWGATLLFTSMASLAVAVPAVPGNLGTYELSILLALQAMNFGDASATVGAFAVAVHAVNLFINAGMGVIGFIQEGISLQQLSQGVREMRPSG